MCFVESRPELLRLAQSTEGACGRRTNTKYNNTKRGLSCFLPVSSSPSAPTTRKKKSKINVRMDAWTFRAKVSSLEELLNTAGLA